MEILKIIISIVVAVIGWIIGHHYTSKRDVKNSQRAIRIAALAEAYKALVRVGIDGIMIKKEKDGSIYNGAKSIEDAIALIHLYGTQEQSILASNYATQVADTGGGEGTLLVNSLRKSIRESLGGEDIEGIPHYLKVTYQDSMPDKNSH